MTEDPAGRAGLSRARGVQIGVGNFQQNYFGPVTQIRYTGDVPYRLLPWPLEEHRLSQDQVRSQPSLLLRAREAAADFTGRVGELEDLRSWRDGSPRLGMRVRLIHGPGGQGKTRLAGQAARLWTAEGWQVLEARHGSAVAGPAVQSDVSDAPGILVVVDYAERWPVSDLLEMLRDVQANRRIPVRVLLLARPAGMWWQGLSYRLKTDLSAHSSEKELLPLEMRAAGRLRLFESARDRFAELLGLPGAGMADAPAALFVHEAYQLVLTVHMAALAAILAEHRGVRLGGDPVEVSAFLLARERVHWEDMHTRRENPLATDPDAMAQAVYAATLAGPLPYAEAVSALDQVRIESAQVPGRILKDHAICYPPLTSERGTMTLEPLYPDRLGEDFIALTTPGHRAASAVAGYVCPVGLSCECGSAETG